MVIFIEIIHGMLFTACYVQVARDQFDQDQDHVWACHTTKKRSFENIKVKNTGKWMMNNEILG